MLNSPEALLVTVAGAHNAGVSAVAETFGPRGGPPAIARIPDAPLPGRDPMTTVVAEPARNTPVYGEFDVVVIGGGPAGITAAAAAARAGRTTLLVERYGFLGGAGTMGGLSTFCGLHAKVHGEHRQVIHGLADEILERLVKLDGLNQPHLTIADGILAQAFDISAYKLAADELVVDAGARLLFHAIGRRRRHGRRRRRSTR